MDSNVFERVLRHGIAIREKRRAVGKRDLLGFGDRVQIVGGVVAERLDLEALEDVEHFERDEALGARRHFEHVCTAVVGADGFDPLRLVIGEVAFIEQPISCAHVGDDGAGDGAFVELIAAALGDELESPGQPWVGEDLAVLRRLTVGQEGCGRGRILRQPLRRIGPVVRHDLLHGEPVARVFDRGLQRG